MTDQAEEAEAMKAYPTLQLLPFYKAQVEMMTPDGETIGLVFISTEKAVCMLQSLAKLRLLDAERECM